MVRWIMTCVSLATFTIGINGERYGYFKSGRGLRQGDPLSPYLFTLIMDVFCLMLARKVEENKKFKFHKGCKEMKFTHMSFADDLLVMCHDDVDSINVIKQALLEFSNSFALLELRNKIRPHRVHIIGNGKNVSMWNDMGYLKQFATNKDIHDARLNENCCVADMIENNEWIWPGKWKNNGQMVEFSIRDVWLDMKCVHPNVSWWKIIRFPQCNPRCAFILWMSVKEKLATQDKMVKWNKDQLLCPLCKKCNDSHEHLFFKCDFTNQIWEGVKHKMNIGRTYDKSGDIVNRVANLPCTNAIRSIPRRLILATTMEGKKFKTFFKQ
uniref:RNA-directed DNA polymerase, eukaryota, reverse transcriptase zinc-binding domain protein n=1 Tax=Tanacetum cinerariifolium TaxID=118510 RepID=A0A6L2M2Z3_TANCI|nr:RNA-directed DNA polymerase, eukaryota, reverse transcriptase zinc-binding domain protein [Tanacetum cinerariifolium]